MATQPNLKWIAGSIFQVFIFGVRATLNQGNFSLLPGGENVKNPPNACWKCEGTINSSKNSSMGNKKEEVGGWVLEHKQRTAMYENSKVSLNSESSRHTDGN